MHTAIGFLVQYIMLCLITLIINVEKKLRNTMDTLMIDISRRPNIVLIFHDDLASCILMFHADLASCILIFHDDLASY